MKFDRSEAAAGRKHEAAQAKQAAAAKAAEPKAKE
jgi:hypothetical protein